RGRSNAKTPDVEVIAGIERDRDWWAGRLMTRIAAYRIGCASSAAQAVRNMPGIQPEKMLRRIDPTPFLPGSAGYVPLSLPSCRPRLTVPALDYLTADINSNSNRRLQCQN